MKSPAASCLVTFSLSCEIDINYHIHLVSKRDNNGGYWDYLNSNVLVRGEPDGAEPPVWSCTLSIPQKYDYKYRYVLSNGNSFVNLSRAIIIAPKGPTRKQHDGDFGILLDIVFPTSSPHWLHSQTQLSFTLGYPDYYTNSEQHPKLGVEFPQQTNTYTSSTSIWNGKTKLSESSHDLHTTVSFSMPHLSNISYIQLDIHSGEISVGKANILASQITPGGHGIITSPIIDSSFVVVGTITFHYSIITPFTHPSLRPDCARKSFPSKPTLVGHRGSGAEGSRMLVAGSPRSHIKENTLLSFEKAGELGAHFVEFDAHLTADLVPVIYHDFAVSHAGVSTPIHSLTLEEFKKIGSKSIKKTKSLTNLQPFLSSRPTTTTTPSLPLQLPQPIFDSFPTLKETFLKVPPNIGFNIEIKYPIKDELDKHNLSPADRNTYVDAILWDVFEYAKDRQIYFSSFDPDICVLLAKKQPTYPVLFLTQMGMHLRSDPRCNSPEASIHFAKAHSLQGIVCPAIFLLENPSVVELIKKAGLVVATWGRDNNDITSVDKQLGMGVNGVIVDHVAYIAKHWYKSLPN